MTRAPQPTRPDQPRPASDAAPMLRRLRAKFIGLNMAIAALVLAASFATICYADYRADIDDVRDTLMVAANRSLHEPQLIPDHEPFQRDDGVEEGSILWEGPQTNVQDDREEAEEDDRDDAEEASVDSAESAGWSPATASGAKPEGHRAQDANRPADEEEPTPDIGAGTSDPGFAPPQIGGPTAVGESSLPVAVYYVAGRTVMQMADRSGATVPDSLLQTAIPEVIRSQSPWGYLPEAGLYFAKRDAGPDLVIAFADGGAADGWRSLALVLSIVSLGALALLFLLNLVFSRWALRPVQQAWTQQQQFIADASHELKTPLTVILANNAILRQRGSDTISSQRQWIDSTQVEAERMQGLVADMLDLARPTTESGAASYEPVDFSRLVEGEVLTFESVAFERDIIMESTVEESAVVRGDERKLQRAVAALLDNACKYTDTGGSISVRLATDDRAATFAVTNSGEPIPAEDLPHLFDRFYRADKARTHEAPAGYGLGLAIARDIAQAHKGALTVASSALAGTTFTLRLPLI
ncbi:HAMP domain-containing sensor histidine kinase [Adlercreutzia sp. R25]|uniref:sensor histidine kinase n=1 Tax=Adlercreutzia shanghongiae TaxID=3111773 RepID=UPI002DB6ABD4|nr:HAMP domain-containing sensor histidine kinase [Adlercreutzia sp. R25]MEC4273607.1 HAMP domain-containing sensor histidine kinase [Adlercreutzia sp. R25]